MPLSGIEARNLRYLRDDCRVNEHEREWLDAAANKDGQLDDSEIAYVSALRAHIAKDERYRAGIDRG